MGDPDLNVTYGEREYVENRLGADEVILCPPLSENVVTISVFAFNGVCSYDLIVREYSNALAPLYDTFEWVSLG